MTPREIALSAISLKKPPRNAATLLSGGLWTIKHKGLTLEEVFRESEFQALRDHLIDIMHAQPCTTDPNRASLPRTSIISDKWAR